MDLKFAATAKPAPLTAEAKRRQKLVRRIDQQIGYVREMIAGRSPRGVWAWTDEAGTYFVPIKYGRHQLELKKGMFSVQCKDLDEVEHAFCTVQARHLAYEALRWKNENIWAHPNAYFSRHPNHEEALAAWQQANGLSDHGKLNLVWARTHSELSDAEAA